MNVYFPNIHVVSPDDGLDERRNLLIEDGTIVHCEQSEPTVPSLATIIDGRELACLPGFLDLRAQLGEPGQEQRETVASGLTAAAAGGFTAVVCAPDTEPAIDNVPVAEYILNRARSNLTELYLCGSLTTGNEGKKLAPLLELAGTGIRMFSDAKRSLGNAELLRRAVSYLGPVDGLVADHPEDHSLTEGAVMHEGRVSALLGLRGFPALAEELAISRSLLVSRQCRRPIHIPTVSTAGGLELIRIAKALGQPVTCDVSPHHFVLTDDSLHDYDSNFKTNPPLRSPADVQAVKFALETNVIDAIASDHRPRAPHEKDVEFDNAAFGIAGLETAVALSLTHLLHERILNLTQLATCLSVKPRRIMGLPTIHIRKGSDANLSILAPDEEWVFDKEKCHSMGSNTPFHGQRLRGRPKYVFNRGKWQSC